MFVLKPVLRPFTVIYIRTIKINFQLLKTNGNFILRFLFNKRRIKLPLALKMPKYHPLAIRASTALKPSNTCFQFNITTLGRKDQLSPRARRSPTAPKSSSVVVDHCYTRYPFYGVGRGVPLTIEG